MSSILQSIRRAPFSRSFSTSRAAQDVAKLTLIGRLGREPELKVTKTDKEYVAYVVATTNFTPPAGPDGTRAQPTTSWHRILSFNPNTNNYLRTLPKGSLVYVEAGYEVRDPIQDAEPGTPESQRQIFLRHESIRLIQKPKDTNESND